MIEMIKGLFIFLVIAFLVFFFIQKIVFKCAKRMILRLIPTVILVLLFILGYVSYRAEMRALFEREAITMAIDMTRVIYTIGGLFNTAALTGCLFGIMYAGLKNILEKIKIKKEKLT